MRKDNKETKNQDLDKQLRQDLHDLWDECDDVMDNKELKHFIDDENQPNFAALNGSDDSIGVEEVLMIGAYMTLCKVHELLHARDAEDVKQEVETLTGGKVKFATSDTMPPELIDILEGIVTDARKKPGNKKPKGKK